eukprot:CAMPEP_0184503816 /NCGR_PEP_ID=MMETSP0113_2-20130426/52110_1 /TAXON_ID=91329 /ORGANISM="Norrisiella sphaerica, Strain BC52" /LENGTH=92 /DNA_ID=CAMNT_0026893373 /DNA_START=1220 /DNA_END=1498 /DNA_ORIENTATION=-
MSRESEMPESDGFCQDVPKALLTNDGTSSREGEMGGDEKPGPSPKPATNSLESGNKLSLRGWLPRTLVSEDKAPFLSEFLLSVTDELVLAGV